MKADRSIIRNISANFLNSLITYVFSFLTVFYAARILQPEAYGKMAFISVFTGYFIMLANLGMPIYAMRLCAEKKGDRKALDGVTNELWSISLILAAVSLVALCAVVIMLPKLRGDWQFFAIYGCSILLQAIGFEWLFRGLEQFRFLALCQLGVKAVSFLCMILFVRSRQQLVLYAVLCVLSSYGSCIICFFAAGRYVDLSLRVRPDRQHFKPLLVFFLMSCVVSVYSSLDLTMLGFMRSDLETGLYSVASKGRTALTMVGGIVWVSILPQATRLMKEGKRARFESLAGKSLTAVAAIQFLVMIVCMVFSREIVVIIGGEAYAGARNAFMILLLSLVPVGMSNILGGQVLIPAGEEHLLLKAELTGALINFAANLFVIPVFSIEGAAATTVVSETVVTIMCLYYAKKKLHMDFGIGLLRKVLRKMERAPGTAYIRFGSRVRGDSLPCLCPCCGTHLKSFTDGGYTKHPEKFDPSRYEHIRQDVVCPLCGSLPRHRILALWCEEHADRLRGRNILYFAPESSMTLWMKRNGIDPTTSDLDSAADLQLDIQDTGLPDASYDVIICNHVLEHVDDFRKALKEVYRILRSDGMFICSFPMDPDLQTVDEDPGGLTEPERLKRFGQSDHRRVFGMDARMLLTEAGFTVERISGEDCPGSILPVVGPADYDINLLFCCQKS